MPSALVYNGAGAGTRSVLSALESLRRALRPCILVDTISTDGLLAGDRLAGCRLLVLPGGADLPYCRALNGHGNELIDAFVRGGGAYLGLCAGAYYACSRVEFELGTALEVAGDRELCFYEGPALGSIYSGFEYASERGAVAAKIRFRLPEESDWQECRDYVNGGPGFGLPGHRLLSLSSHSNAPTKNVEILATFPDKEDAAAAVACSVGLGRAVLCSSHPELAPSWLGLPAGAGRSDAVAYQRRGSGSGGLDGPGGRRERTGISQDDAHLAAVAEELHAHGAGRWALWTSLLIAAGLGEELAAPVHQRPGAAVQ